NPPPTASAVGGRERQLDINLLAAVQIHKKKPWAKSRLDGRLNPERHIVGRWHREPERSILANWVKDHRPVGLPRPWDRPCWKIGRMAGLGPSHGLSRAGRPDIPGHPLQGADRDGPGPPGEQSVRPSIPRSENLDDHGREAAEARKGKLPVFVRDDRLRPEP